MHGDVARKPVDDEHVTGAHLRKSVLHADDARDLERARHDGGVAGPRADLGQKAEDRELRHARGVRWRQILRDDDARLAECKDRVRRTDERQQKAITDELDIVAPRSDVSVLVVRIHRSEGCGDFFFRLDDRPLRAFFLEADFAFHRGKQQRIAQHQLVGFEDGRGLGPDSRETRFDFPNGVLRHHDGCVETCDLLRDLRSR